MSKAERLNIIFSRKIAFYLSKNPPTRDSLITIKRVDLKEDLSQAIIKVSILPINLSGSSLKSLRKLNKELAKYIAKEINLRKVPKLIWQIDSSEEESAELDKIFKEIENEKI
jgi:ribosome-binding factor A